MLNKFALYYRQLSLPLKATIWFAICQFLQKGISLLTTPFFTRLLSTEEYGIVSTFISWENILIVLITLSLSKSIMNLCVRQTDIDKVLSSILGLSLLVSVPWLLLFIVGKNFICQISGLPDSIVFALFFCPFFQGILTCWITRMEYEYQFKPVIKITLLYSGLTAFGGLAAVIFVSPTAAAKIYVQTFSLILLGCYILATGFKKNLNWHNKEIWKFAMGFSVPLIPHYLSEIILQSSDKIMINYLCGASDVGIYSVAYSVGSLIAMVTCAVNSAFVPFQYHKIKAKEYKELAQKTNIVIAFIAICLCVIMLLGREIVLIFGGKKYIDCVSLIIPICLGIFFNYLFQSFARVQEYFVQKHTIVIASVSCAALNIILNYIFIEIFGYQAAAYTTFVCYFVFCFLHYLFYRMVCKKNIGQEIYDIRGLVAISAALIFISVIIGMISEMFILKYVIMLLLLGLAFVYRNRIIGLIKSIKDV